jgi:hypothetical protein
MSNFQEAWQSMLGTRFGQQCQSKFLWHIWSMLLSIQENTYQHHNQDSLLTLAHLGTYRQRMLNRLDCHQMWHHLCRILACKRMSLLQLQVAALAMSGLGKASM